MATKKPAPKKSVVAKKATPKAAAKKASPSRSRSPRRAGIRRMAVIASASTLDLSVSKTGGPMSTHARVVSTGTDSRSFEDSQLTPGPATMPLDGANSYTVVWTIAFVEAGSATLDADVSGANPSHDSVTVDGDAGDIKKRFVVIP